MRYPVIFLFAILALITPMFGADFSFVGAFTQDDERRQFTFTLVQPGTVLVRSWSYAGGVNASGAQIGAGGFDPSLALFDSTGLLLATNQHGGCTKVAPDRVTAWCWDAFVNAPLPGGTYRVILTESANTALGPYLANPFVYDGSGNFTAAPRITDPAGFWDFWPDRRNSSYALDIRGVDSAQSQVVAGIGTVLNSANWQPGPAGPNTILTLFHPGLPGAQPFRVLIDGQNAEILYNGSTANFVVPPSGIAKGNVQVQVWSAANLLVTTQLVIADASPGLFTANQSGTGQASVLNLDYTRNGTVAPAKPVKRGSYLIAYGTGFGRANPPGPDGISWLAATVTATIGGIPAEVTFAGLAPGHTSGLQQINIRIPNGSPVGPAVPIRLQAGAFSTQLGTTIAVE